MNACARLGTGPQSGPYAVFMHTKPPGAPVWLVYVAGLSFAAGIAVAAAADRFGAPQWVLGPVAVFLPLVIVGATVVVYSRRQRRAAGLVPSQPGFSNELALLASKLRERADEVEHATRFRRHTSDPSELASFAAEIRSTAQVQDNHVVIPDLLIAIPEEVELGFHVPIDSATQGALKTHVDRLRNAASELDGYRKDLLARGGIYHVDAGHMVRGVLGGLACAAAGIWLIWTRSSTQWLVWCGVALVALSALTFLGLYVSKREAM